MKEGEREKERGRERDGQLVYKALKVICKFVINLLIRKFLNTANRMWHKRCYKCSDCKHLLSPPTCHVLRGRLYCKHCLVEATRYGKSAIKKCVWDQYTFDLILSLIGGILLLVNLCNNNFFRCCKTASLFFSKKNPTELK